MLEKMREVAPVQTDEKQGGQAVETNGQQQLAQECAALKDALQMKQRELAEQEEAMAALQREIADEIERRHTLEARLELLQRDMHQYEEWKGSVKRVRQQAESEAFRLVEEAKAQAMDAVCVLDDVLQQIEVLRADLAGLKGDLQIGTATVEDRVDSMCYALGSYQTKLRGMKQRFYEKNGLPLDENE
ncbi:MAG TPA: hypothetical protein IAA58_10350 [Candidatus Gallacutalibacter stercoravium]|nr:hypothetical protein [Candidatus Gallacutalibacter stercoravium]